MNVLNNTKNKQKQLIAKWIQQYVKWILPMNITLKKYINKAKSYIILSIYQCDVLRR